MEYADIRYNNGVGALVCNRCFVILEYGFEHEDKFHFCKKCAYMLEGGVMANHVTSFVRIMAESSNVLSHWKHRILPQMGTADPWASLFRYEGEVNREWMCSAVGAKWSFVDYADEDSFELCSAWCHPSEGITGIAHILGKEAGPEFVLAVTYTDEMPNFFGCEIIDGHGFVVDYEEWSNDDLIDYMLENVEGLAAEYVNDELTAEGWEIWHENVWDCVSLLQEDWMKKCLNT